MKLYLASSWKNPLYESTAEFLKLFGHEIMDWQKGGFSWKQVSEIPPEKWKAEYYRDYILHTPRAKDGFWKDVSLMDSADACVLLLPAGRSAHIEAGVFVGKDKPLFIYMPHFDGPDLMYKFAQRICFQLEELQESLQEWNWNHG